MKYKSSIKLVIADDEANERGILAQLVAQYGKQYGVSFDVQMVSGGEALMKRWQSDFKIILLDSHMPGMNGIQTAEEIRKKDAAVIIILTAEEIPNAREGYSFNIYDYMLKPVNYYSICEVLNHAILRLDKIDPVNLVVRADERVLTVSLDDIFYIEAGEDGCRLFGKEMVYSYERSRQELEELLMKSTFAQCHRRYFINLANANALERTQVMLGERVVPIEKRYFSTLIGALTDYVGGVL